jgi:D-methionine transport system substrate-binding protein
MLKAKLGFIICAAVAILSSCGRDDKKTLRVVASPTPHTEMLEFIAPEMKKMGINLEIITLTDYLLPNRLIDENEADANFFQHIPFLEHQKSEQNLKLEVLGKIHLEPMGLYSFKEKKGCDFNGKTIALPLDPSNESRALKLLSDAGIITLNDSLAPTIQEIQSNPYEVKFLEIDAALLPRIFDDVDFACIPTNFALQIGLNPSKDAMYLESEESPYANIVVIHPDNPKRKELEMLLEVLHSEKMQTYISESYQGAIIPVK